MMIHSVYVIVFYKWYEMNLDELFSIITGPPS